MHAQYHTTQKYNTKIQHTYNTFIQHAYNTKFIQHEKYTTQKILNVYNTFIQHASTTSTTRSNTTQSSFNTLIHYAHQNIQKIQKNVKEEVKERQCNALNLNKKVENKKLKKENLE